MNRKTLVMAAMMGFILAALVIAIGCSSGLDPAKTMVQSARADSPAAHVRWDIQSLDTSTTPNTSNPGGVADALFPAALKITFTGSGTFVAPASGGTSNAVTGGGTWQTFTSGVSTGSGTYRVVSLVSWQFDTFQTGTFIDNIDEGTRANGNAELRIEYSDSSEGVLTVGCHGPGADPGIFEGVTATKAFVTYWTPAAPTAGVDRNRTVFHVR